MEFRFNLNEIFKEPIVEIGSTLVPHGFTGDKRALWDTQSKITQIVNAIGEASATAQGLSKPITTADRLRNSEHKLYLLVDHSANSGRGAVTGMLKIGEKGLYVFDREGQHYQVSPPCILDFYVHESRQRAGFGKALFEHMLQKQQIEPVKMAIDRPSDKLLGFLNKHYRLDNPVKQMNNYVVYDGFFPRSAENSRAVETDRSYTPDKKLSANGLQQGISPTPYGRYGAPRPPCSMGQIIHNDSAVIKRNQEPTGVRSEPFNNTQGQNNMFYSNQTQPWQTTQSVPNMQYAPSQNPQNYPQISQQNNQRYAPNQQYAQSAQQYAQNVSNHQLENSGDYQAPAVSQNIGKPTQIIQEILTQYNQKYDQSYQQTYANNSMGQGDATILQPQTQQQNTNYNVAPTQSTSVTYQGQNFYYNPHTQQYEPVTSLANLAKKERSRSYKQAPKNQQISYKRKEPLIPQCFDGSTRTIHQSASLPTQGTQENEHLPVLVQGTASAPISYQQQPYTYNAAAVLQPSNQNVSHMANQQNTLALPPGLMNPQTNHLGTTSQQVEPSSDINQTLSVQNTSQNASNANYTSNIEPAQRMHLQNTNQMVAEQSGMNQQTNNPIMVPIQQGQHQNQIIPQNQQNANNVFYQNQPLAQNSYPSQVGNPNSGINTENLPVPSQANSAPSNPLVNSTIPNTYEGNNQHLSNQMEIPAQQYQQVPTDHQQVNVQNPMIQQQPQLAQQQQLINNQHSNVQNQPNMLNVHQNVGNIQYPITQHQNVAQHQEALENQLQNMINAPQNVQNLPTQQHNVIHRPQPLDNQPQNIKSRQQENSNNTFERIIQRNHDNGAIESDSSPSNDHSFNDNSSEKPAQNNTPRADRPQSLNIELPENLEQKKNAVAEDMTEEGFHGERDDIDSLDEHQDALETIEHDFEKIDVASSRGSKSPGLEAAGIVTPGRSTPGLTDRGYFDLKFYHNKLW